MEELSWIIGIEFQFIMSKNRFYTVYTVKFDITDPSVLLVKICQNPLYQEIRYIEGKFTIDYDNPFLIPVPIYQDFTYGPVYRGSGISNFHCVPWFNDYS